MYIIYYNNIKTYCKIKPLLNNENDNLLRNH